MEKKLENMTKKELIERINDLETQYTKFGVRAAQDIDALTKKNENLLEELKHKVYAAATARENDIAAYKMIRDELKKKNEAIHEEAKRWKKEAVAVQAELDVWTAKYNVLKYQFDKLKDEDRKWTSANPAVQAALERKINVLEKEINKYKAQASEWEAKYEYQDGQTDCVIKDYNALNKKYTALLVDYEKATHSDKHISISALEARIKDLIRQCDELYDKNKELDAENAYLTEEVDKLKDELKEVDLRMVHLYNKNNRLKETINKVYGVCSGIPDITDTDDFEARARKCTVIFSKTIDAMIRAYDLDVNSYDDGSITGIAKTVNAVRGAQLWLDALENSMKKFSEEAEKYIKKVGGKK